MDSPCFSPSRGGTTTFLRCPRLYDLNSRWIAPDPWKPEISYGNALHAGLAAAYTHEGSGWAEREACAMLALDWQDPYTMPNEGNEEPFRLVEKVLKEAMSIDLLGDAGTVLAVEQEMGPEKCHPDLVIKHGGPGLSEPPVPVSSYQAIGGSLQVVDWKFSMTLKPEWVAKRLASYETSWQLHHYAWRCEQEFGLPCKQVSIVQMAALPKPFARRVDFEITKEGLQAWEKDARKVWQAMADGYNPHNPDGCRKYGEDHLCQFYTGCWTLHGDESKFSTLYRRKA